MTEPHPPSDPSPSHPKISNEVSNGAPKPEFTSHRVRFPNPPEIQNPDPATLRDQWRFAIKQYSKWYSHAWGTAILAGISFFALGWVIKGSNPLPSRQDDSNSPSSSASTNASESRPWVFDFGLRWVLSFIRMDFIEFLMLGFPKNICSTWGGLIVEFIDVIWWLRMNFRASESEGVSHLCPEFLEMVSFDTKHEHLDKFFHSFTWGLIVKEV